MHLSSRATLAVFTCVIAFVVDLNVVAGWTSGRATFYDDNTEGSCRYGTNIPDLYAAWPDGQNGAPACGKCYEVCCVNKDFNDGYGERLSRSDACYDEGKSVIVKIVDSCPCVHENYFSNQRWCCGDMAHIDLGSAAFGRLADSSHGVIGARWREVSCDEEGGDDSGLSKRKKKKSRSRSSSSSSASASASADADASASASASASSESTNVGNGFNWGSWGSWFGR